MRTGGHQPRRPVGCSLNLNVHYHVVVPDGVFVREREHEDAASVSFLQLPLGLERQRQPVIRLGLIRAQRDGGSRRSDRLVAATQLVQRESQIAEPLEVRRVHAYRLLEKRRITARESDTGCAARSRA